MGKINSQTILLVSAFLILLSRCDAQLQRHPGARMFPAAKGKGYEAKVTIIDQKPGYLIGQPRPTGNRQRIAGYSREGKPHATIDGIADKIVNAILSRKLLPHEREHLQRQRDAIELEKINNITRAKFEQQRQAHLLLQQMQQQKVEEKKKQEKELKRMQNKQYRQRGQVQQIPQPRMKIQRQQMQHIVVPQRTVGAQSSNVIRYPVGSPPQPNYKMQHYHQIQSGPPLVQFMSQPERRQNYRPQLLQRSQVVRPIQQQYNFRQMPIQRQYQTQINQWDSKVRPPQMQMQQNSQKIQYNVEPRRLQQYNAKTLQYPVIPPNRSQGDKYEVHILDKFRNVPLPRQLPARLNAAAVQAT